MLPVLLSLAMSVTCDNIVLKVIADTWEHNDMTSKAGGDTESCHKKYGTQVSR